jgi:hypothetical protein
LSKKHPSEANPILPPWKERQKAKVCHQIPEETQPTAKHVI